MASFEDENYLEGVPRLNIDDYRLGKIVGHGGNINPYYK
jgi:hypothetical protein